MKKKKILSAFMMLLITAVALSTASYAWFTENTTVSVDNIDVEVQAANGIQISANASVWNASISNEDITTGYTGHTNQLPDSIVPVSTGGVVTTAVGATQGYLNMYKGAIENSGGNNILTAEKSTEVAGTTGDFIVFDMFILSTQQENIYLTSGSSVTPVGTNKGLQNAARAAFLIEGNVAAGTAATAAQALKTATTAFIWEPNNNVHTPEAVANNTSVYGTTITTTSVITSYPGVKADILAASNMPLSANATTHAASFNTVTPNLSTGSTRTTSDQMFTVSAGITKIRVYLWVEGQDIDCENNASGSNIRFTISLSKNA